MKILLVTEFFPTGKDLKFSGGVEARTFFVAKHLAKNHTVKIIATKTKASKRFEKMFNFSVYRVGPDRNYQPTAGDIVKRIGFISEAIKTGIDLKPDIADGANFISHFIVKRISSKNHIPAVAWYPDVWIGSWLKNAGLMGILGEILERLNLILGFDDYIAISKTTEIKLKKFINKKIHIIPCGVEEKEFNGMTDKFPMPTIISISRLAKYKNIKTLILAFAHLSTKMNNIRLIIVGSGPEYKNLKNLSKILKINTEVKFPSDLPRKELIKLYKSSYIFSLPSTVEGFGIATIEAAAAGLPYVISDTSVHREVTKRSLGGFLVDPGSPIVFSRLIQKLLTDKKIYQKKSREAKMLATSYDWQKIASQTGQVYQALIKK